MRKYIIIGLLMFFAVSSCTVTKDVVNNSFVQKRKYNKGFFVKNVKNNETIKKHNEDIVINNSSNKDIEEKSTTEKSQIEEEKTNIDKELLVSKANKILLKPKLKSNIEIPYYFKGIDFIKARKKLRKIDIEPDDDNELKNDPVFVVGCYIAAGALVMMIFSAIIAMLYVDSMFMLALSLFVISAISLIVGFLLSISVMIFN